MIAITFAEAREAATRRAMIVRAVGRNAHTPSPQARLPRALFPSAQSHRSSVLRGHLDRREVTALVSAALLRARVRFDPFRAGTFLCKIRVVKKNVRGEYDADARKRDAFR